MSGEEPRRRLGRRPASDSSAPSKSPFGVIRLVILLGLLLLGVQWAGQAKNWQWVTGKPIEGEIIPALKPLNRPERSRSGQPVVVPHADSAVAILPEDWLTSMQDEQLGLLASEQSAIDLILDSVRTSSLPELQNAAILDVSFAMLNDNPQSYRGRLLQYEGMLWKLNVLNAGDPQQSGDEVYEAWLYTPDAGNEPMRVLLTELSPTLRSGERIQQPVEFAGYFVKRYGYPTRAGTHFAPMLVARSLTPAAHPSTRSVPSSSGSRSGLPRLVVVIGATLFMLWRLASHTHSHQPRLRQTIREK